MIKKSCFILILLSLFTLLPAYMTIDNEIYLKILVKSAESITLLNDGLIFINGQEYQSNTITITSLPAGKVRISLDKQSFTDEPHKFEISLTGNFYTSENSKQQFSGDIHLREYQGKIAVMNLMNLESYTGFVVTSEIGSGAPTEALKTQAIVARTYAIYMSMKNSGYPWDLQADTSSQVFNTKLKVPQNVIAATKATAFMLVTYKGEIAFTPFSGNGGGYIADVENVWGGKGFTYLGNKADVEYLQDKDMSNNQVVDNWINTDPAIVYQHYNELPNWMKKSYKWEQIVSFDTIADKGKFSKVYSAIVDSRDKSGRISKITFNTASGKESITAQGKIRTILDGIPSALAIIKVSGNNLIIEGKGNGHGVGFCQAGGYLKSYAGWDYVKIIKHYFPGCEIKSDYFFNNGKEDELESLFK